MKLRDSAWQRGLAGRGKGANGNIARAPCHKARPVGQPAYVSPPLARGIRG